MLLTSSWDIASSSELPARSGLPRGTGGVLTRLGEGLRGSPSLSDDSEKESSSNFDVFLVGTAAARRLASSSFFFFIRATMSGGRLDSTGFRFLSGDGETDTVTLLLLEGGARVDLSGTRSGDVEGEITFLFGVVLVDFGVVARVGFKGAGDGERGAFFFIGTTFGDFLEEAVWVACATATALRFPVAVA